MNGQAPVWLFGKAITSRIESELVKIINNLSRPKAIPPCGGNPESRAFKKNQLRAKVPKWPKGSKRAKGPKRPKGSKRAKVPKGPKGSKIQIFKGQGSQKDPKGSKIRKLIRAKGPKRAQRGPDTNIHYFYISLILKLGVHCVN